MIQNLRLKTGSKIIRPNATVNPADLVSLQDDPTDFSSDGSFVTLTTVLGAFFSCTFPPAGTLAGAQKFRAALGWNANVSVTLWLLEAGAVLKTETTPITADVGLELDWDASDLSSPDAAPEFRVLINTSTAKLFAVDWLANGTLFPQVLSCRDDLKRSAIQTDVGFEDTHMGSGHRASEAGFTRLYDQNVGCRDA